MSLTPLGLIRLALAGVYISHGIARIWLGNVSPFGSFLSGQGFPLGIVWAWAVTIIEIVGGVLLAIGRHVTPVSLYFVAQNLLGIYLVHLHAGWFVVGPGRNGVEYGALLTVCLIAVIWGKR